VRPSVPERKLSLTPQSRSAKVPPFGSVPGHSQSAAQGPHMQDCGPRPGPIPGRKFTSDRISRGTALRSGSGLLSQYDPGGGSGAAASAAAPPRLKCGFICSYGCRRLPAAPATHARPPAGLAVPCRADIRPPLTGSRTDGGDGGRGGDGDGDGGEGGGGGCGG
jgi:hypothetical protein